MKPRLSKNRSAAMTLFEVGVVIAIVMILAILILHTSWRPNSAHAISQRINCVNNLKQTGLAYRIWEGDNGDIYPMGVSVTNGGSMEMVATGNAVQTFQVMSNELGTPRILYCPADSARTSATAFTGLDNSNISYFVGVDVTNDAANPQLIMSGDCNFEIGGVAIKPGLRSFWTNDPVVWSAGRHVNRGNLGLADGSVQQAFSPRLRDYFQLTGLATNRFAIP
jgi:prepilin-type processing-associated H-X9-DG protein